MTYNVFGGTLNFAQTQSQSRFSSRCGTFISVCSRPPRSTQPGHPFVGRCNEYQRTVTPCGWE